MANIPIHDDPILDFNLRAFETTDRAHADLFNAEAEQLINNDKALDNRLRDVELFKFPNATIIGDPVINNGQVSGFSSANYLQFPYLVDFFDKQFVIDTEVTTGTIVTTAQKIFDSNYGISFGVDGGKFLLAISSSGFSWDIVNKKGEFTVEPNTTYRLKLTWDKSVYKLLVSIDGGESYTEDITVRSDMSPFSEQVYIGIRYNKVSPFLGIINLNRSSLLINSVLEWQGMDDVGIASRMDKDLSNVTNTGKEAIKSLAREGVSQSQGRNLIPFPYSGGMSKTENGMTFTVNDDGSITMNGTVPSGVASPVFYLVERGISFKSDTSYVFSLKEPIQSTGSVWILIELFKNNVRSYMYMLREQGQSSVEIPIHWGDEYDVSISIRVKENITINKLTYHPMLEEGVTVHAYEPTPESNISLKKDAQDSLNRLRNAEGVNLNMTFAQLKAKVSTGDFSGLHLYDYIDFTMSDGEEVRAEIMGFNTMQYFGGPTYSSPHVLMQFRDCLATTYKYNESSTNAGGYDASALKNTMENTIYNALPEDLRGAILRCARAESTKNNWTIKNRNIFLPTEFEVFGHVFGSEPIYGTMGNKQWEGYVASYKHVLKGLGKGAADRKVLRAWWLSVPYASNIASFCYVNNAGLPSYSYSEIASGVAPAFLIG